MAATFPLWLRFAALVLPSLLLALLLGFSYFVLDAILPRAEASFITLIVGVAGIYAFSAFMFTQLTRLHDRQAAQSRRLEELARSLEGSRQQLQALNVAGLALSAELDSESVLRKIVGLARNVAAARYAALGIFDEQGRVTQFLTEGISDEARARIGHLPEGRGVLGVLPRERKPIRLRDLSSHPASVGFPPGHPPMRSFLGVPIVYRDRSLGNLYLTEKQGADEFTAEDERAVVSLAAQAAVAIENARLYEQAGRVSMLDERQRIGMDLHDGAMQSLYGVGLLLEDATDRLRSEPEAARSSLERAVDRVQASIGDMRAYVRRLRTVSDAGARPLAEALPQLGEEFAASGLLRIDTSIDARADEALDQGAREGVFYVAADALANAARHARARTVTLSLSRDDGRVVLDVADDGVGFDPTRAGTGFGLRNMRERAFALGGRLDVESAPGKGTRVRLELPAREEARA